MRTRTLNKLLIPALVLVALGLSACMSPEEAVASKPQPTVAEAATVEAEPAVAEVASYSVTDPLPDGTYRGRISGSTATITVRGGQPSAYRWQNYTADSVTRSGRVISIDAATLTLTAVGPDSFQGNWNYNGYRQTVTFKQ